MAESMISFRIQDVGRTAASARWLCCGALALAIASSQLGATGRADKSDQDPLPVKHATGLQPVWNAAQAPAPSASSAGHSLDATGNVVVASGIDCSTFDDCDWFVRAMNPRTGETRWEDRYNGGLFDDAASVTVEGGRVFASGFVQAPPDFAAGTGNYDFVVRAYDARTGSLLWQAAVDRGFVDKAYKVAAHDGCVFAAGKVFDRSTSRNELVVFAFDAATGAQLWESRADRPSAAWDLLADRGRLFAAGPTEDGSLLVRALDAATGAVLWEDDVAGAILLGGVTPRSLAAHGDTLILGASIVSPSGDLDALVRTYDASTGALEWSRQWDGGGNDLIMGVAASGERVVAIGEEGTDEDFIGGVFSVRVMDSRTGRLQWTDRFQAVPGGDAFAEDVVVSGDVVFVGGSAQNASGFYTWILRAYDGASGRLVGADPIADDAGDKFLNILAVDDGHLYAAGYVDDTFFVRGYTTHGRARP